MPRTSTRPSRLRWSAGLVVLALGAALAPTQQAAADHTPAPSAVTLAGSLQSELGCPGDWQPECTTTRLTPVAGEPSLFRATFTPPPGSYEYKVALNGGWGENYGANGAAGGANIPITSTGAPITFTYDHRTHVISDDSPRTVIGGAAAHWLRRGTIAWDLPADAASRTYRLHWAPEGGLRVEGGQIVGGESAPLSLAAGGLPAALRTQFPHLASFEALSVPDDARAAAEQILTGQILVAAYKADGSLDSATAAQVPGILDEIYAGAAERELGPVWTAGTPRLSLWAPTAKDVDLLVTPAGSSSEQRVPMTRDADGVWSATGTPAWRNAEYRFDVRVYAPSTGKVETNLVTDPYSLGLTTNSARSLLVDLADPALAPKKWDRLRKPGLSTPENSTIYELHVRDFSISDETVPAEHRGTYLAFTDQDSNGMTHLRELAKSGLNTVHLLPVNDISSIEEDRAAQQTPQCDLESYAPDSEEQQECVEAVRAKDGFNWGYDPLHYTTPEGSYSTDPEGTDRIREFREMVAGLNKAGQRVVIDVVYNHTPAAGQDPKSILDRVVPGYYHRLNTTTGAVETSTCCSNTATEHRMMEKLMIDSVLTWAREYKIDGFRFDLMGHQPKSSMIEIRERLDALTLERDGVDGRSVYMYGEGWNFGEVANNARFVQATQAEMAGTGIGTFNDRLRDAVRGGGPFDGNPRIQGFASGLYTDPNGDPVSGATPSQQLARLLLNQDQIKVGLTGNLRDYRFVDRTGATVTGAQVDYNGSPAGYNLDPQEAVTYVEAHDNETLFDVLTYKLPTSTSMADRVRMQALGLSTTALGQGVSFWHAGGDMLRSKSLDRNSYDSGDWFNILDFTYQENGFGRGLPPKADNESKYPYMRPLLANRALDPDEGDIQTARRHADALLRIRQSTPLFHLGDAALVQQKVSFPNGGPSQTPGVITMRIDDTVGRDVDRKLDGVVVVFNARPDATTQVVPGTAGAKFRLHPVQADGFDPVVKGATHDRATGAFTVPARTVAVFVQK